MNVFSIIIIAIISAVICILLKQYKPEYAIVASLACGVLIFALILKAVTPAFQAMTELMQKANISAEYVYAITKALGICYITQLAADTCRDAEQSALASKVELSGRVAIVVLCLPLFKTLVETAFTLINANG